MENSIGVVRKDKDPSDLKLSIRQRRFIKFYLESGNASAAALKAGYKDRQRGYELVLKLVNLGLFQELLEQNGLTDDALVKVLHEGLQATKVVGYLNQKIDGTQKVSDEFVEIPDYHCRHRYLETALKLKNKFLDKKDIKEEIADKDNGWHGTVFFLPVKDNPDSYKPADKDTVEIGRSV